MDSLLASYAFSDEEEEEQQQNIIPSSSSSAASLFSSLPNPNKLINESSKPSSALFNSIPKPKSQSSIPISDSSVKRVVQFKPPPINPNPNNFHDDDDDDEDEKEKERKRIKHAEFVSQSSNVKSFLSSIPAPKNSRLGVLGSGRKSNIGVEVAETPKIEIKDEIVTGSYQNEVGYDQNYSSNVDNGNPETISQDGSSYGNYSESSHDGNYGDYYSYYGQYDSNNWNGDGSASAGDVAVGMSMPSEIGLGMSRKRGRNEIPAEIIEVKQDELTKNRPREDQVKMTGIAFGPSYQPASTKGKPSKLHKRKHQIGSLFFDMKQKEMELAERRSKGLLTKAQTHAKYGW